MIERTLLKENTLWNSSRGSPLPDTRPFTEDSGLILRLNNLEQDMKNSTKIAAIILLILGILGCEDESLPECVQGKVIGYQSCYDMLLIEVLSQNLGEPLTLGDRYYQRVVQCPVELLTGTPLNNEDRIYFRFRNFDPERDTLPDGNQEQLCHPSVFPLAVPIIVITDYSTENCP
jgi:hypothetical protein